LLGNSWFIEDFWPGEHIYGIVNGGHNAVDAANKGIVAERPEQVKRCFPYFREDIR
jgi:hypothetical protein